MTVSTELQELAKSQQEFQRRLDESLKPSLKKWIRVQCTLKRISEWSHEAVFEFQSLDEEKVVYKTNHHWRDDEIILEIPMGFIDDPEGYIRSQMSSKDIKTLEAARDSRVSRLIAKREELNAKNDHIARQLDTLKNLFQN